MHDLNKMLVLCNNCSLHCSFAAQTIGEHRAPIILLQLYWWVLYMTSAATTKLFLYSSEWKSALLQQWYDDLPVWSRGTGKRDKMAEQQHPPWRLLPATYFIVFKRVCSKVADWQSCHQHAEEEDHADLGNDDRPWAACSSTIYWSHWARSVPMWFCCQPPLPPFRHISWQESLEKWEPMPRLLEIKCPDQDNFTGSKYLCQRADGSYAYKPNHEFHFHIMGQMGITGMAWCDFICHV